MQRRHRDEGAPPRGQGATPTKLAMLRARRRALTPAERMLWQALRRRALGARFRNGHVVAGWIVDFYEASLRLAVEVDGGVHEDQAEYDAERSAALRPLGITVVRVTNDDVFHHLGHVLERLQRAIVDARSR